MAQALNTMAFTILNVSTMLDGILPPGESVSYCVTENTPTLPPGSITFNMVETIAAKKQ